MVWKETCDGHFLPTGGTAKALVWKCGHCFMQPVPSEVLHLYNQKKFKKTKNNKNKNKNQSKLSAELSRNSAEKPRIAAICRGVSKIFKIGGVRSLYYIILPFVDL